MLQCQGCNRIIMDSTESGWKLRTRMVLFDSEGNAEAICPSCKTRVAVPVHIGKIDDPLPKPKLFINPA
jgi:hypothetical protein